jgi:GWxTD domain-containing protein
MRCLKVLLLFILPGFGLSPLFSAPPDKPAKSKNSGKAKQETGLSQYYKKWLDEDVVYIITSEESSVFRKLQNDEERESFIERFWNRRNPDRRSSYNSFKEDHYRRIAYANEHFASGIPGWKTDRGRVYIKYGKPDTLATHPAGGTYDRPSNEGGGPTTVYPFEKWWYRHIDGIGEGIELEFVDLSGTGEYRLARNKYEKDALINVPDAGPTLAEMMHLSEKKNRAYFNPYALNDPNSPENIGKGAQDMPFAQMEIYFDVLGRAPKIKFTDLKTAVSTQVYYDGLTYNLKTDCLKLTPSKVLVPITIELNNSQLEFKMQIDQTNQRPSLEATFLLKINGKVVEEFKNTAVNSEQFFYGQRVVLVGKIPLKNILPGKYTLDIRIYDKIANRSLSTSTDFAVKESNSAISSANP